VYTDAPAASPRGDPRRRNGEARASIEGVIVAFHRWFAACAASLLLALLAGCVTPATVIVVRLDSDIADDRRIELQFTVTSEGRRTGTTQLLSRGVRADELLLTFPSSLSVQPRRGESAGGAVNLRFAVRVLGRNQREQDQSFVLDRTVQFAPGQTRAIDVFLSSRCVGVRCPAGSSCGADGRCAASMVESAEFDRSTERDARASEVGPECTPDCTGRTCGDDGCGGQCGTCSERAGSSVACTPQGTCQYACAAGRADCDLAADNGCEADLRAPATCGRCDVSCSGATPVCGDGRCASGCPGTQRLCDGLCVDLQSSAQHCGACGERCEPQSNATATCAMGNCERGCLAGFGDCDGDPTNGCETDTRESAAHCGHCGNGCGGGTPVCNGTTGMCSNGCGPARTRCGESCPDLRTSTMHCGACGAACTAGPNSTALCTAGSCELRCDRGFANCDGDASNGCEVDTTRDANHCGGCGIRCAGVTRCEQSTCVRAEQLTVRSSGACVRLSNGTAECWGSNNSGAVGNGTLDSAPSPRPVSGLRSVTDISANSELVCAVDSGRVYCWGRNTVGELGGSSAAMFSNVPLLVPAVPMATRVRAGGNFGCALTTTGTVWCWGYSADGQCGTIGSVFGGTAPRMVPLPMAAQQIATGAQSSCALLMDGTVACWGSNAQLALGQPMTVARSDVALVVPSVSGIVELAAGDAHFCGRRANGTLRCWGSNVAGQLASPMLQSLAPLDVAIPGTDIRRVWAGGSRTCILGGPPTSPVYCFGNGPLGNGTAARSSTPVAVGQLRAARDLAFVNNGCQITASGEVECWGSNGAGALGDNSSVSTLVAQPIPGFSAEQIVAGNFHFCARSGTAVSCWGANTFGAVDPTPSTASLITPLAGSWSNVATGYHVTFAQPMAGAPVQWFGATSVSSTPGVRQSGTYATPTNITQLASSTQLVCVVHGVGAMSNVSCNTGGWVFNAPTTLVPNTTGATRVLVGTSSHRCAMVGSEVRCWGSSSVGALGTATSSSTSAEVAGGITNAVDFALGTDATLIVRADGSIRGFGSNTNAQLGVGDTMPRPMGATVALPAGVRATRIAMFSSRVCAITADRTLYCWGTGGLGAFLPGTSPWTTPVLVAGATDVADVAISATAVCFRKSDRTVWCWGANTQLALGVDGFGYALFPRSVAWAR
jgi:alpha-tubulin suppressor-like RCC1 family protein